MDFELLKKLCAIHAPSGSERPLRDFVIDYVNLNSQNWKTQPELIFGDDFQDCLILKFGKPRTAIFSHFDSHGFTVRYQNQLVPIGSPEVQTGIKLVGEDGRSDIECTLIVDEENRLSYEFGRAIETGTTLVYKPNFIDTENAVQSCYLDNRLGVFTTLKMAESLKDGFIVFSCWEEHGGGSVPFLIRYLYENYKINQCLVADITWATDGVQPGEGVVISLRDKNIPRKAFLDRILSCAESSGISYQLEVEGAGSSDGREIHHSPYPIDWCFIGAAEENVHSPKEKVDKGDVKSMIDLYLHLMKEL